MARLSDMMREDFARFKRQAEANLQVAAQFVQDETRQTLSRPYPPASRRGEAPARRSGTLRDNQIARVNLKSGTIILNNDTYYATFLRPTRPWEDITLHRIETQLAQILTVRGYRETLNNGR